MKNVDIETNIIIMQYDNNFVCPKWIFYIASSALKAFVSHFVMKKFEERLCCTEEHLRLLKYLKIIVFLRRKYMHLSSHCSLLPVMTSNKAIQWCKIIDDF